MMVDLVGPIVYMHCECYVWPIATWDSVGRCGRCRTVPEGNFETKEEGLVAFTEKYGRDVEPF